VTFFHGDRLVENHVATWRLIYHVWQNHHMIPLVN
jgi:hypothetical protein